MPNVKDFDDDFKKQKAEAEAGLIKHKSRAKDLLEDPEKTKKVLEDAYKKANDAKGPLEKVFDDLMLMFYLVRDWIKGEYKEVPVGSIVAILGGILYFLSPIDAIPDVIPVAGYLDDVFVLGLIIKQVSADLKKYKNWKESKEVNLTK